MANRQTISFIKRRLSEAGIYPVSRYGQNFLTDLNLVRMIADSAELGPQDIALEIGTGTGSLTAMIAEKAGHVITVEIDKNLHQLAREELASFNNITFLQQDALRNKNNFSQELLDTIATAMAQIDNAQLKLVANLPYNIATPIISNLLTLEEFFPTSMTATIQKELGDRRVILQITYSSAPPAVREPRAERRSVHHVQLHGKRVFLRWNCTRHFPLPLAASASSSWLCRELAHARYQCEFQLLLLVRRQVAGRQQRRLELGVSAPRRSFRFDDSAPEPPGRRASWWITLGSTPAFLSC